MGVQGFNMITLKIAARRLAVAAAIFPWLITAAMAQPDGGASCNPTLDVNLEDGPFFLNQPIQASADLGAGDVVGGTRLDITQFSYGLDCMAGQDFDTCTADGNTVIFNGVDSTSCVDALGDPVVFSTTPNGVFVDFTPMSGQPLRIMSNQSCNVQFNFTVTALNGADNLIFQTMGWDADDVECDTDPISNSGISSNLAFGISLPPQLTLVKEVVNDNGGTAAATEWILTASGSGGFSGPGVGDPSQAVNGPNEVEAGVTYALSESGPTGYDTDGYICVGDGVFDDAAQTITLDFNESATCTIVNDDFPLARFAVTKDFSDDNSQEVLVQVSCSWWVTTCPAPWIARRAKLSPAATARVISLAPSTAWPIRFTKMRTAATTMVCSGARSPVKSPIRWIRSRCWSRKCGLTRIRSTRAQPWSRSRCNATAKSSVDT
jgi:hypothetical protein